MATTAPTGTSPAGPVGANPGYQQLDDLRHWPAPGGKMRDSLFWQITMPDERLGLQIYLFLTDRGRTGYNVTLWGPEREPVALYLDGGTVGDETDFDDFRFSGLTVAQREPLRTAEVRFTAPDLRIEYSFEAVHAPFSYHSNPDGLPQWFARNRMEQSGRVSGFLEVGGRRIEWDQRMGHRDHSWGPRDWGIPQHWKWFVAYTDSGRAVNGWIWIAKGEWGFAGYVLRDGHPVPVATIEQHTEYDAEWGQRRLDAVLVDVDGGRTHLVLERFGIVRLPTNDKMDTEIREAACVATVDGEPGAGQFETHWQASYLRYLVERGG